MSMMNPATATSLPDNPTDIASYVQGFCRRQEKARTVRTAMAFLAEAMYEGQHWYRFDPMNGTLFSDWEIFSGFIDNKCRWAVDLAVSAMTASRFVPDVYTIANSAADLRGEKIARAALQDSFFRNGGFSRQQRRGLWTYLRGDLFVEVGINREGMETLIFDNMEAMAEFERKTGKKPLEYAPFRGQSVQAVFRCGSIREIDINPTSVVVPNAIQDFEDATQFAIIYHMPVANIRQIARYYNADPNLIKAVDVQDTRRFNLDGQYVMWNIGYGYENRPNSQDNYRVDTDAQVGQLVKYWEKDSDGYWSCIYLANDDLRTYIGGEGGFQQHNLVHLRGMRNPNKLWGRTAVEDIAKINTSINKLGTALLDSLRHQTKDLIIEPSGAKSVVVSDQSGPTKIVYNPIGGQKPEFISSPNHWFTALERAMEWLNRVFDQRARISDILQGQVGDRSSTETMRMASSFATSTLTNIWQQFKDDNAKLWEKELYLIRTDPDFSEVRLAAMIGPGGESDAMEFRQADIRGSLRFRPRAALPQPQTIGEIRAEAIELMATPYFAPGPPGEETRRIFNEYVESGGMNPIFEPVMVRMSKSQALEEHDLMRTGQIAVGEDYQKDMSGQPILDPNGEPVMVPVLYNATTGEPIGRDYQNDELHAEVHNEAIQDPGTAESLRRMIVLHMETWHGPRLSQAQQQAMDEEVQQAAKMSIAEGTAQIVSAQVAKDDTARDPKKPGLTPRQGGINSGQSRAKEAAQ